MNDYQKIYNYNEYLEKYRRKTATPVGQPLPPLRRSELHLIEFQEMTKFNDYLFSKRYVQALDVDDARQYFSFLCRTKYPDIAVDIVSDQRQIATIDLIEPNFKYHLYLSLKEEFEGKDSVEEKIKAAAKEV